MNYHFISDDNYIIPGIRYIVEDIGVTAFFHNVSETRAQDSELFLPQSGDVVCIIVNNTHIRSRLLRNPALSRCRLLIMLDIPLIPSPLTHFPWLLPKNTSMKDFADVHQIAARTLVFRKAVTRDIQVLFDELGNGKSPASLSGGSRTDMQSVYRIKRNVFREFGLMNCNSAGILLCRDIFAMKNTRVK